MSKFEKELVALPVREGVEVKLLPQELELYVWRRAARASTRECAMRRKLKWLWARLKQIAAMNLEHEELLMKLSRRARQSPGGMAPDRSG